MSGAHLSVVIQGQGWTGGTTCDAGTTCVKLNDWYSQCQPGSAPGPTSNPPPGPTTTTTNPGTPVATGLDKAFKAKSQKSFGTCSDSKCFNNPTGSTDHLRVWPVHARELHEVGRD